MRITSKTVHDINKIENNFELRYGFTYRDIISRTELVPSPRDYAILVPGSFWERPWYRLHGHVALRKLIAQGGVAGYQITCFHRKR
jgi:hypothetical protein